MLNTSAPIPAANGVAEEVPPNAFVYKPSGSPCSGFPMLKPLFSYGTSVVKILLVHPLLGARKSISGP